MVRVKHQQEISGGVNYQVQSRCWEFVLLRVDSEMFPYCFRNNASYCSWSSKEDGYGTFSIEGYVQFPSPRRMWTLYRIWTKSVWQKADRTPVFIQSSRRHRFSFGFINPDKRYFMPLETVVRQPGVIDPYVVLEQYVDSYRQEREEYIERVSNLLAELEDVPIRPDISIISMHSDTISYPPESEDEDEDDLEIVDSCPPTRLLSPETSLDSIDTSVCLNKLYED